MIRNILALLATSSLAVLGAAAQDVAIDNAKLWTGDRVVEGATLIIQDGKVTAVGPNASIPAGTTTIDADGAWVTPGIFAAYSRMGIVEVSSEVSTNDSAAGASDYSIALDMSDGFNPNETTIDVTRLAGVTRVAVAPGFGSSLFGGQGFIADTSGKPNSITKEKAFTFINLGEGGSGLSGGSRPAAWAKLRAALVDARTYPARYFAHNEGDALSRVDALAFGPASRGSQLILLRVSRASDIREVIELKAENSSLNIALVGAEEGWMVAEELADADIPVIIDPFANLPGRFESLGATQYNAERLIDAGVPTAFSYFDDESHQTRLILQVAGNAVANGVDHEDALRAITTVPARIYGMSGYGSLQTGSAGDVVIWDGDPLEITSAPTKIYIDGVEQSLESRQTRLRDRYLSLDESQKPLAYKR
ncbi:amidohydrolase family protein [Henriciella sp. AS95]|uniref:amidohydrolase family protein n=1 Tax=Henriciella sp. AS95 TaxID=3135782 RepID=UPI0031746141